MLTLIIRSQTWDSETLFSCNMSILIGEKLRSQYMGLYRVIIDAVAVVYRSLLVAHMLILLGLPNKLRSQLHRQ